MQSRKSLTYGLLTLSLGLAATSVAAGDDCNVPVERWQSRDAVMQVAGRNGWQVQRLSIDDGCYEIVGRDASGRGFKAKLDPQTLDLVKMKVRDRHHDRDRDPTRSDRGSHPADPMQRNDAATTPSAPLLSTPGTAPRGQIE